MRYARYPLSKRSLFPTSTRPSAWGNCIPRFGWRSRRSATGQASVGRQAPSVNQIITRTPGDIRTAEMTMVKREDLGVQIRA
jgi:hypothetical protein